jgi:serine/threonine protein phosphatase PrpC
LNSKTANHLFVGVCLYPSFLLSEMSSFTISSAGRTSIGGFSQRENQDAFLVSDRLYCVADGHGGCGKAIAESVCATVAAQADKLGFIELFAAADTAADALIRATSSYRDGGGTTATVLKIDADGSCRVAHVGDSEVRVFDTDEGDGVALTQDHSALSLAEFQRIRARHGEANFLFQNGPYTQRPVFVQTEGEWKLNPLGGFSYCNIRSDWSAYVVSREMRKLAMTRAIGDFDMRESGVISTPDVVMAAPHTAGIRAIVLASDGLWDAMHYSEVCTIVRNPEYIGNAEVAAERLLAACLVKGSRLFGGSQDNVAVIVIYITV